jgi:hypothetical protein
MSRDWQEAGCASYDLMFVTCGYEARSTFLYTEFQGDIKHLVVLDYGSAGIHSYDRNRELFEQASPVGWIDLKQSTQQSEIAGWIDVATSSIDQGAGLRVLFDISSCSRSTMAKVLTVLALKLKCDVQLTCAYAVSAYFAPPEGELPSSVSEPVIGDLSGWSSDLSKPPCAIIGLGFEPGRALGSIDYLEVPEVRLFLPDGPDGRFADAVIEANRHLINEPGVTVSSYHVLDPVDAYQKLESMVLGLLPRFRPIIIPLGPKIFAALSMLLALRLLPQVCIWRTSAGSGEEIADRPAGGEVAVFDYVMRPEPSVKLGHVE